jgi:dihydrofolate reductase
MSTTPPPPPQRPRLVVIAALARNRAIGRDNALLWHLPEDMKHFREATTGHPVIMGRRTWESLPERFRPLPGRRNLVVTRQAQWQAAGAGRAGSLEDALAQLAGVPLAFVIGGAELYAAALPLADELLLTEIDQDFDGDCHFPPLPPGFTEVSRASHRAAAPNDFGFAFVTYRRA